MTALATSSGGSRATAASSIDHAIRLSTAAAVLAVAARRLCLLLARLRGGPGVRRERAHRRWSRPQSTASCTPPAWSSCTRPGTGYRSPPWPAGCSGWASRPPSPRTWPRAGHTVRSERWSRPGQRPASSARMNSWSGSSAPPGRWNANHRQSIAARAQHAAPRRVPPPPQPLTAGSTARTTATYPLRAGSRRGSLPGGRPLLPARSMAAGFPEPTPVMTQRSPRTGSA